MNFDFLNTSFLNNTFYNYLIALIVFAIGFVAINIFKIILIKKLKNWVKKTTNVLDDFLVEILEHLVVPFLYFSIFYLSIKSLTLNSYFAKIFNGLSLGILILFIVRLFLMIISYAFKLYWFKTGQSEVLEHSLSGILKVIKFVIWSLAGIFFLDNLGFKISTVIAGLGIGGVAIALAAQALLKDLFSYFSIIFDRPFEVGDFIIIGDLLGTVEHIGIKTTRLRSLGGEQLIFSNSDLTDSRVRNYKRMGQRRVVFKIGVVYQTNLQDLKDIPKIIEKAIKNIKDTAFDRAHFFSFGDFSLIFEVVYYVLGSDYNKYMDIQQETNFAIKEEFEKRKIEFAYPTQIIHLIK
ncbi:MAG: mechanosensitive ion channel family protein [Candidatus Omnitrophica bacterium]|jgi:small-conductance mechanosensitive channel|nr:mechanosensitive ion channel family protein [Candidatus Omnitrophota bacterium]